MTMKILYGFVSLLIITSAPSANAEVACPDTLQTLIKHFDSASPEADAMRAISQKNTRYLAVPTLGYGFPGVPSDVSGSLLAEGPDGFQRLSELESIYPTSCQVRLGKSVSAYATKYNRVIYEHRKK